MAAALETRNKRWTYDEYFKLDEDQRYEILNGELLMAPSPDTWHQSWVGSLYRILDTHTRGQNLGKVFLAPLDVVLDPENSVQPDLVFVSTGNLPSVQRRAIFGVPDLLVEVVSPSSVRRDRYTKKELYARFGVKEYWIADPANASLEVLALVAGRYELHCSAEQTGKITSRVLTGLEYLISKIWHKQASMEKSAAPAHKTNADLELPDWSGMDDCSRRLTKEQAFRLLEEYMANGAGEHRARKEPEEVVEFKL